MNLAEYGTALDNFMGSKEFASLPPAEGQEKIKQFRDGYLVENPGFTDTEELNQVTENRNKSFLRATGQGRAIPDTNNIIFPNQEPDYKSLTQAQRATKLEEFKLKIPELAAANPTQKEDTEFFLNESLAEIQRENNGENTGYIHDKASRLAQGVIASFADGVGATDTAASIRNYFHENPKYDPDFMAQLLEGAGSAVSSVSIMVGASLATKGLGGTAATAEAAGIIASLASNGVMRFNEAYTNAIKAGIDPEKANDIAITALPGAVVDVMSDKILASKILPDHMNKVFASGTEVEKKALFKELTHSATYKGKMMHWAESAIAEGVSETAGDYVAAYGPYLKTGDDQFLPTDKQSLNSFLIGGIIGGALSGAMDVPDIVGNKQGQTVTAPNGATTTPNFQSKTQRNLTEVQTNLEQLDTVSQNSVYDLLAKGRYKEAFVASKQFLNPVEEVAPDITPEDKKAAINTEATVVNNNTETATPSTVEVKPKAQVETYLESLPETSREKTGKVLTRQSSFAGKTTAAHALVEEAINAGGTVQDGKLVTKDSVFKLSKSLEQYAKWYESNKPEQLEAIKPPSVKAAQAMSEAQKALEDLRRAAPQLLTEDQQPIPAAKVTENNIISEKFEQDNNKSSKTDLAKVIHTNRIAGTQIELSDGSKEVLNPLGGVDTNDGIMTTNGFVEESLVHKVLDPNGNILWQKDLTKTPTAPTSAFDYISNVAQRFEAGPTRDKLNTVLLDIHAKNPELKIVEDDSLAYHGKYEPETNTIHLSTKTPRVMVHEVAHGLTAMDIFNHITKRKGTYKEKLDAASFDKNVPDYIKSLINVYYHAAKATGNYEVIGAVDGKTNLDKAETRTEEQNSFVTLDEFVAEALSSQKFQNTLANIPYKGKTIWQHIVEAITSALPWIKSIANPELVLRSNGENALVATLAATKSIIDSHNQEHGLPKNNIMALPKAVFQSQKDLEKVLEGKNEGVFKSISPAQDGSVKWQALQAKLKTGYRAEEVGIVEDALAPLVKDGRVNLADAVQTLDTLAKSSLTVNRLDANTESKSSQEESRLSHELDTKWPNWKELVRGVDLLSTPEYLKSTRKELPDGFMEIYEPYMEARSASIIEARSPESATARYTFVNPKPLNQMADARDITIEEPLPAPGPGIPFDKFKPKFSESTHFPTRRNVVGFGRMYDEVLPSGEPVTFLFEAQSDWASKINRYEKASKEDLRSKADIKSSPFLSIYEHLVLKATIHDALAKGQNHVAITDAETAMMTEQHDKHFAQLFKKEDLGKWYVYDEIRGDVYYTHPTQEQAENTIDVLYNSIKEKFQDVRKEDLKTKQVTEADTIPVISQEKGMRAAYGENGRLHNIMRKLTGSQGERVNFGTHQNGTENVPIEAENGDVTGYNKEVKGSKVFTENSAPKSSITAIVYPLDKVNQQEISTLFPGGSSQQANFLPKNNNQEEFYKELQARVKTLVNSVKKTDFQKGDEVWSITGGRLKFLGDGLPDRDGMQKIHVSYKEGNGEEVKSSYRLDRILLEKPDREDVLLGLAKVYSEYKNKQSKDDFIKSAESKGYDLDEAEAAWAVNRLQPDTNYLPAQTINQKLVRSYTRLNDIKNGLLTDKYDGRTQEIIRLLSGIKTSDVGKLTPELQSYFFSLVDNIYESRKNAVQNPAIRFDSDDTITQITLVKQAVDAHTVAEILNKYDDIVPFDELNIDTKDPQELKQAINDYLEQNGTQDYLDKLAATSAKSKARLEAKYQNWRDQYTQIKTQVKERYADAENYIKEVESLEGSPITSPEMRQALREHYNYLHSVDINSLSGIKLYQHFYAINNMFDGSYYGLKLTVEHLAQQRNILEKVKDFAGTFRDAMVDAGSFLNFLDRMRIHSEIHAVQGQRLSAFDATRDLINNIMLPIRDGVMRTSMNLKESLIKDYTKTQETFEQKVGRKLNTEDQVAIAIVGRLSQFEQGANPDTELAKNIKKEYASIKNKTEWALRDEKRLYNVRVKATLDHIVKGLEVGSQGSMQQFMNTMDSRLGATEGVQVGAQRKVLLSKMQEIFSKFNAESKIIKEGIYGETFKAQAFYVPNDVMTVGDVRQSTQTLEGPLQSEYYQNKTGITTMAGNLQERQGSLGNKEYYSYNPGHTLMRNIERIAVDHATVFERHILAARLKSGELKDVIANDKDGFHPKRLDFLTQHANTLLNNAVSKGEPQNLGIQALNFATRLFAIPALSSYHHIISQPLTAAMDYAIRTGDLGGWLSAAQFYATNHEKMNKWFEDNQQWTFKRSGLEANALDTRRTPTDDSIKSIQNHPFLQWVEKTYEGAAHVMTYALHTGDNFSVKATVLAEYARLLKQKGYKFDSIDQVDFGTVEGRILSQATQNAEKNVNTSNKIMRGELFTDRRITTTLLRNVLFAFAAHSANLATQFNQATRDIGELKALGAPRAEINSKLKTIAALLGQQFTFTSARFVLGGLAAKLMLGLIKDLFDDEEGKIADLQQKVYIAQKKGDPVKVAMAEHELQNAKTVRSIVTKIDQQAGSGGSYFKQVIRDGSGAFSLSLNTTPMQKLAFFIPDAVMGHIAKQGNDAVVADLHEQIKTAHEHGHLKQAAALSEQATTIGAAEYIPLSYPINQTMGIGGVYGAALDGAYKNVSKAGSALMGAGEWNYTDFITSAASLGIGQAEIDKYLRYTDRIENDLWKQNKSFEESGLPKAQERKHEKNKLKLPSFK